MTDLTPVAEETPVPQLETTTRALGGTGNPMNRQAQALLNRDALRAEQINNIGLAAAAYTDALRNDLADDTDPIKGSDLVGYRGRAIRERLSESPSIDDYPNSKGLSNDTAAFAALEAELTGAHVDLLGRIYIVDSVPNGNDYFNGAFSVGGQVYWLNQSQREHPLANPVVNAKALRAAEGKYRGLSTAAFYRPSSGKLVLVYREALGHAPENNTPINCAISDDFGDRFGLSTTDGVTSTVIAQQSNADIRNWASGEMGNGRLGILAARRDIVGGTYLASLFLYSDDDGATWQTVNVPITTSSWDSHSRIYPYPASVGGHDTLGWIAYAYTSANGICAMYTVNNGSSWTEVTGVLLPTSLDPLSEAANLSEMSVARVGNQNKWVMVVRTNQEAAVSVSTDMLTWSSAKLIPETTLAKLLANPPELTYEDGKLWFWSFSRRGSKEIYPQYANALLVSEADPGDVFASDGVSGWKQWRVVSALSFWPSGYMNRFTVRNRPYVVCTTGEDTAGGSTSRQAIITLLGPDPTVSMTPRAVMRLIPNPNLFPVSDLRYFPLPGPFTSGASRVPVTALTSMARNGGVAGATVSRLAGNTAQYKLRVRRNDGDTSAAAVNVCVVFAKEDSYQLRNRFVTVSFDASAASGFSSASNFLTVRMRQTSDGGEGVVTSNSGSFPVGDTTVQSSGTGVTLQQRWQRFELIIGPFSSDMEQAQLQLIWTPSGTALNDYFEIENLKIEEGKIATPLELPPLADAKSWCDRFIRIFDMPTASGNTVRHLDPQMHRAPTVSVSGGSSPSVVASAKDYVTIAATGSGVTTVTAIAVM